LARQRDNAIMVIVTIPGERWEVEFFDDSSVEAERFVSSGEIGGEEMLSELLTKYSDHGLDQLHSGQSNGLEVVTELHKMEQVLTREKIHA
jgi:hypothetical protein